MSRVGATVIACALVTACATGQGYEGPRRGADEVARITGDLRVTAGAPVSAILRKVDGYELGISESSVEVLPGTRRLIVDCRVAETKSVARFTIDAEVYGGQRYRLVARTGPGLQSCKGVDLENVR
jgi:hypothetical protein